MRRDTREMYAEFLRYRGFAVVVASDPDAAYRRAGEADAIVTGLALRREHDGLALIRRIREDARTATVPIVVLAARVFPADRAMAAQAGGDVFLAMPCLPDHLARTIRGLLLRRVRGSTIAPRAVAAPRGLGAGRSPSAGRPR